MVIKIAQQARKHRLLGLFLAFFFFAGCKHSEPGQWQLVSVWWEDDEALGLVVPVIRLPGNFVKD